MPRVCLHSCLSHPICKAHQSYYTVIYELSGCTKFSQSQKRHDFLGVGEVIEHKMCVLIFSTTFVGNISHSAKNSARYCHKFTHVFRQSARYSCQILKNRRHFFRKILKYQTLRKFVQWEPNCSMRTETDRQQDSNSRWERA